jgi:hypothetical protein
VGNATAISRWERSQKEREEVMEEYDDVITYCDINECKDCPRMGDDCDGEFDDDEE